MKLIIDIPDEAYEMLKNKQVLDNIAENIIANGTPYEEKSTGYWEDHKWCSNCGCGIPTDVYGGGITEEEAHFCVECGTDMRRKCCDD